MKQIVKLLAVFSVIGSLTGVAAFAQTANPGNSDTTGAGGLGQTTRARCKTCGQESSADSRQATEVSIAPSSSDTPSAPKGSRSTSGTLHK